jgi:hypothetical protein
MKARHRPSSSRGKPSLPALTEADFAQLAEIYNANKRQSASVNTELEIRMGKLSESDFMRLYETALGVSNGGKIQRSVTATMQGTPGVVVFVYNESNELVKSQIHAYEKKNVYKRPISAKWLTGNVSISQEERRTAGIMKSPAHCRVKLRSSLVIGVWRADFTRVYSYTYDINAKQAHEDAGRVRKRWFSGKVTAESFAQIEPVDGAQYEAEFEFIGGDLFPEQLVKLVDVMNSGAKKGGDSHLTTHSHIPYEELLGRIGELIGVRGNVKKMGNKPRAMSRGTYATMYKQMRDEQWFVTPKADGTRVFLAYLDGKFHLVCDDERFRATMEPTEPTTAHEFILDCEAIKVGGSGKESDDSTSNSGLLLLVFDCMHSGYSEQPVHALNYPERLSFARAASMLATSMLRKQLTIQMKAYTRMTHETTCEDLHQMMSSGYHTDGLIFVSPNDNYAETVNKKWKPPSQVTIDFLAKKLSGGRVPSFAKIDDDSLHYYVLFVGANPGVVRSLGIRLLPYHEELLGPLAHKCVHFAPAAWPRAYIYATTDSTLDGKVIELSLDAKTVAKPRAPSALVEVLKHPRAPSVLARDNEPSPQDDEKSGGDEAAFHPEDYNALSWRFHRARPDRTAGNYITVAVETFANYIDPFPFTALCTPPEMYFSARQDNLHKEVNRRKRANISAAIRKYVRGGQWLLDQACGRGADLYRYRHLVRNAVLVDVDAAAVAEALTRIYGIKSGGVDALIKGGSDVHDKSADDAHTKHSTISGARNHVHAKITEEEYSAITTSLQHDAKTGGGGGDSRPTANYYACVCDLKRPYSEVMAELAYFGAGVGGYDVIICNFATHYFCDTAEHLDNLIQLNTRLLKRGGLWLFSTMSGERVHKLLSKIAEGESWIKRNGDGELLYQIEKRYSGELVGCGQNIAVKLPFSDELREEPLCNIEHLVSRAKEFEVLHNAPFETEGISPEHVEYTALYQMCVLRKR